MLSLAFRVAYRVAYRGARVWWFIRRPRTRGAVVALWHGDRVLLVRASYRPHYTLPGGFVGTHEAPIDAAVREAAEELHLELRRDDLVLAYEGSMVFEDRVDAITVWEARVATPPAVRVDRREIVWADWKTREEALDLLLLPHVRRYLTAGRPHDGAERV